MVMRAHCDRCDVVIEDPGPGWVELEGKIYHHLISAGKEDQWCRGCKVIVLRAILERLAPTEPAARSVPIDSSTSILLSCVYSNADCKGAYLEGTGMCEAHSGVLDRHPGGAIAIPEPEPHVPCDNTVKLGDDIPF